MISQMNYSYVMGIDDSIEELKREGFTVEADGGNYTVAFPKDKSKIWERFISEHLEVEYWNEYITENNVIFLFHLEDGFRKYEVVNFDNDEVLKLCEKLCDCKFGTIKQMLIGNHFYKKVLNL